MPNTKEEVLINLNSKTKIDPITNYWLFEGSITEKGYGLIMWRTRMTSVHRLSAHLFLELDLDNKDIHALHKSECKNKNCWNPAHLYLGNNQENQFDSVNNKTYNNQNTIKTHCQMGHEFIEENTYVIKATGYRRCKECHRTKNRNAYHGIK